MRTERTIRWISAIASPVHEQSVWYSDGAMSVTATAVAQHPGRQRRRCRWSDPMRLLSRAGGRCRRRASRSPWSHQVRRRRRVSAPATDPTVPPGSATPDPTRYHLPGSQHRRVAGHPTMRTNDGRPSAWPGRLGVAPSHPQRLAVRPTHPSPGVGHGSDPSCRGPSDQLEQIGFEVVGDLLDPEPAIGYGGSEDPAAHVRREPVTRPNLTPPITRHEDR